MAGLTIRNFDEVLKRRLRVRAAENDRSMQDEAQEILRKALVNPRTTEDMILSIKRGFAEIGLVDVIVPSRNSEDPTIKFVFADDIED